MEKRLAQLHYYRNRFHVRWPEYINGRGKKPVFRNRSLPKGISKEDAEKARQDFCIDLDNVSWNHWCDLDLAAHRSKVRQSTIDCIQRVYAHVWRICAPDYLKDVNNEMLLEYRGKRQKEGCKPGTLNTEITILKAAFNRAIERGAVDTNPVNKSLRCRPEEKSIIILSSVGYQLLLEIAPTFDWELIIAIGYHSGLRIGEILSLNTWNVNLEHRILTVSNSIEYKLKSGKGRQVPISPQLLDYLKRRLEQGRAGRIVSSVSLKADKHCSYNINNAARGFARICEKAGFVNNYKKNLYTTHTLRRTCITNWVRSGCSMDQVKDLAGHASITTTAKYYCQPSNVCEIQAKLDQKWGQ